VGQPLQVLDQRHELRNEVAVPDDADLSVRVVIQVVKLGPRRVAKQLQVVGLVGGTTQGKGGLQVADRTGEEVGGEAAVEGGR